MSKQRILLAALLALILGWLMWLTLASAPREPVYEGRPLRYWLAGYDAGNYNAAHPHGPSAPTYTQADDALRHLGTNSIPTLIRMLREQQSPVKSKLIILAQKLHFIRVEFWSPANETMKATRGFHAMGAQTVDVAPQFVEIYDSNPCGFSRQVVPEILRYVAPTAPETMPLLLRALTETNDAIVRANAASAIEQIRPESELVVPALTKALTDPDTLVQIKAADALASYKEEAKSAVPTLIRMIPQGASNTVGTAPAGASSTSGIAWGINRRISFDFIFAPFPQGGRAVMPVSPQDAITARENALREIDPGVAQASQQ